MRHVTNVLGIVALLSLFIGVALLDINRMAAIALMCEGLILFIMFTVMDDKIDEQKKADAMRRNTYRY
jgi:membrane-bound ClpP family serine protease